MGTSNACRDSIAAHGIGANAGGQRPLKIPAIVSIAWERASKIFAPPLNVWGPLPSLNAGGANQVLEALEVVADRHSQRQQFFEGVLGLVEAEGDAAGLEADALRQALKFLRQDLDRGLDQQLGALQ